MRDSLSYAWILIGSISTVLSIFGVSLGDIPILNIWSSIGLVFLAATIAFASIYFFLGQIFKDAVELTIRNTPVSICFGDIFKTSGWKIINCDTHFDSRVDDTVISKISLHGQLFLKYGNEIKTVVEDEGEKLHLHKNKNELYDFPLGTIIKYDCKKENQIYLLLAMTELNEQYEAHIDMAKFEHMLMRMWKEISRVYVSNDVVLPLLGSGITRFDDGPKGNDELLRCMLCTLNSSGVTLNAKVKVVLYNDLNKNSIGNDIQLYEYKDMFRKIN